MATTNSDLPTDNPEGTSETIPSINSASKSIFSSSQKGFVSNLLVMIEDVAISTIRPILIIFKNTVIFGLFILVDKFVLWLIISLLNDEAKVAAVNWVLQGMNISSAIIIGFSYVVRLSVELYNNREEFLGISPNKKAN